MRQPTEILGQFDPSNHSAIETTYESEKAGRLITVIFRYASKLKIGWGDADCEFVCAIEILSYNTPTELDSSVPPDTTNEKKFVINGEDLLKVCLFSIVFVRWCSRAKPDNGEISR